MNPPNKQFAKSTHSTPDLSAPVSSGRLRRNKREADTHGEHLSAARRIKSSNEFARVFKEGKIAADGMLVVHARRVANEPTRLGLSISKKVGCAPRRNRWKRLIREAFRRNYAQLPQHLQLVIRPRRGAVEDYQAIRHSLKKLANRLEHQCLKEERV